LIVEGIDLQPVLRQYREVGKIYNTVGDQQRIKRRIIRQPVRGQS